MAQTTTDRGRALLTTPDPGFDAEIDGGAALGTRINTLWTTISDNLGLRWSGSVTVANGNFVDVVHNFVQPSDALKVILNQSTGARYTLAQVQANFTISYPNSSTVRVTNSSGGSLTFFVTVLPFSPGLVDADFDEQSFGAQSDDLILNKDASGSGADWRATLRRPSSGMAAAAIHTLPSATGVLAALGLAQSWGAAQTFTDLITSGLATLGKTSLSSVTDAASTGANVNLGAGSAVPAASVLSISNAALDGVAGIFPPSPGDYRLLFLANNTGGEVTIKNSSGSATAGGSILTGSGADITTPAGGVVPLIYSPGLSAWVVFGGGGGSGGGTQTITQGFAHGFAVGDWVSVDGAGYLLSAANNENNSRSVGRVSQIVDANSFVLQTSGFFTSAGLFTVGRAHHVSTTAGAFQVNPPTGASQWTKQLFTAITDSLAFINFGPAHVSGATVGASGSQDLSNKSVLLKDGGADFPSMSFVTDPMMGFYRASAGVMGWSDVNGVNRLLMSTSLFAWSGGRLDVISTSTNPAQVRTRTAAGDEAIFGVAAQGNQLITGSTIGDTCYVGKAGQEHLWSADGGTSGHFGINSTRVYARVKFRWANLASAPAARDYGDSYYRTDLNRFMGVVGPNTTDVGFYMLSSERSLQSFGTGGDMTAMMSDLPFEIFPVRGTLSGGNFLMAALFFTATAPLGPKLVQLVGTSDADTITLQDSRGTAKGLVMNGDWTSGYGRTILFRYVVNLDRWVEMARS